MPKYQMLFDTVRAEQKFNVDIDEQETLDVTLDEILFELRERGDYLRAKGSRKSSGMGVHSTSLFLYRNKVCEQTTSFVYQRSC